MQNNIVSSLFENANTENVKRRFLDNKKPILIIALIILSSFVIFKSIDLVHKEKSEMDVLVDKIKNNTIIMGDQLEIQKEKRTEKNELQKKIDLLNNEINASIEIVKKSENANKGITAKMIYIANPNVNK